MDRKTLAFLLLVNAVVISFGALIVYYDLWMRRYSSPPYELIKPIKVDWYFLGYHPTYRTYDGYVLRGSWTLDFLQLSVIVMAIADVVLLAKDKLGKRRVREPPY